MSSDDDFWDVGGADGPRPARRRTGGQRRKSSSILELSSRKSSEDSNSKEEALAPREENEEQPQKLQVEEKNVDYRRDEDVERREDVVNNNEEEEDEGDYEEGEDYLSSFESDEDSDEGNSSSSGEDRNLPLTSEVMKESLSVPDINLVEDSPPSPDESAAEGRVKRKKLVWQSKSSSDIKSGLSSVDQRDEAESTARFQKRSPNNDIGYPPKARLKNSLYRGRQSLLLRQGDLAVEEFVRSYALARIVHGDYHWRTCRCRVFLAQAYLYLKEFYSQAEEEARAARDILTTHLGTCVVPNRKLQVRHLLAMSYLLEGEARLMQGKVDKSVAPLCRALTYATILQKKMEGSRKCVPASLQHTKPSDVRIHVLRVQAEAMCRLTDYDGAKTKLEVAIKGLEEESDEEDMRLVGLCQQYGELLITHPKTKNDDITRPIGKLSGYDVTGEVKDNNSEDDENGNPLPDVTRLPSDDVTGGVFFADDIDRGLTYLSRALDICKNANRPGSEEEIEARVLLIRHRVVEGRCHPGEALRELHRLYTVICRGKGEISVAALNILSLTVQVHLNTNQFQEATKLLSKLFTNTRNMYGEYSKQSCNVLKQMGQVRASAGDITGQAEALSVLLSNEVLVFGNTSARTSATRDKLREILQKVSVSLRMKLERKHPELQVKPRFRSQ